MVAHSLKGVMRKVESKIKISSTHIKTALMAYFRFKRQFVCADEVGICYTDADIVVDTGGFLWEVECKISKSDLTQGEKRKDKHVRYAAEPFSLRDIKYVPNHFYICVPTELLTYTIAWVEKTNPKYGVLEYEHEGSSKWEDKIRVVRKAKFLHEEQITPNQRERIIRRLSSARAIGFQDLVARLGNIYGDCSSEYHI